MLRCAKTNAKKRGLNANFLLCDAENLPFLSNALDIVNCIDALVARPEGPKRSISEIARVLKVGGIAIIEPSNILSLFGPLWWIMNLGRKISEKLGLKGWPSGVWLFPWQAKKMITEHGLELVAIRGVGIFHPISKKFLKTAIALEEKLNRKSVFRSLGSRIILVCHKSQKTWSITFREKSSRGKDEIKTGALSSQDVARGRSA